MKVFNGLLKELHEIGANRSLHLKNSDYINKNVLIESCIIISFKYFDVLDFWEPTEWIDIGQEDFQVDFILQALDHVHHVIDHVATSEVKEVLAQRTN